MKEIVNLYNDCYNYLFSYGRLSAFEIIQKAVRVLKGIDELKEIRLECAALLGNWNKKDIDTQGERADVLVEELSGYLGEYLA